MKEMKRRKKSLVAWILALAMVGSMIHTGWDKQTVQANPVAELQDDATLHLQLTNNAGRAVLDLTLRYTQDDDTWRDESSYSSTLDVKDYVAKNERLLSVNVFSNLLITCSDPEDYMDYRNYSSANYVDYTELVQQMWSYVQDDNSGDYDYVLNGSLYVNFTSNWNWNDYTYLLITGTDINYYNFHFEENDFYKEHMVDYEQIKETRSDNMQILITLNDPMITEMPLPTYPGLNFYPSLSSTVIDSENGVIHLNREEDCYAAIIAPPGQEGGVVPEVTRQDVDYWIYENNGNPSNRSKVPGDLYKKADGTYFLPAYSTTKNGTRQKAIGWRMAQADGCDGLTSVLPGTWNADGSFVLPQGTNLTYVSEGQTYNYSYIPELSKTITGRVLASDDSTEALMEFTAETKAVTPPGYEYTQYETACNWAAVDVSSVMANLPQLPEVLYYEWCFEEYQASDDEYQWRGWPYVDGNTFYFKDRDLETAAPNIIVYPVIDMKEGYVQVSISLDGKVEKQYITVPEDWILRSENASYLNYVVPENYELNPTTIQFETEYDTIDEVIWRRGNGKPDITITEPTSLTESGRILIHTKSKEGVADYTIANYDEQEEPFTAQYANGKLCFMASGTDPVTDKLSPSKFELYKVGNDTPVATASGTTQIIMDAPEEFGEATLASYRVKETPYLVKKIYFPDSADSISVCEYDPTAPNLVRSTFTVQIPTKVERNKPEFPNVFDGWVLGNSDGMPIEPQEKYTHLASGSVLEVAFDDVRELEETLTISPSEKLKTYTVVAGNITYSMSGPQFTPVSQTTMEYGQSFADILNDISFMPGHDFTKGLLFNGFKYSKDCFEGGDVSDDDSLDEDNPNLNGALNIEFDFVHEDTLQLAAMYIPVFSATGNYGTIDNGTFEMDEDGYDVLGYITGIENEDTDLWPIVLDYSEPHGLQVIVRDILSGFYDGDTEYHEVQSGVEYQVVSYEKLLEDIETDAYTSYTGWKRIEENQTELITLTEHGNQVLLYRKTYSDDAVDRTFYYISDIIAVDFEAPFLSIGEVDITDAVVVGDATVAIQNTDGNEYTIKLDDQSVAQSETISLEADNTKHKIEVADHYNNQRTAYVTPITTTVTSDEVSAGQYELTVTETLLQKGENGYPDLTVTVTLNEGKVFADLEQGLVAVKEAEEYLTLEKVEGSENTYKASVSYENYKNGLKLRVEGVKSAEATIEIHTGYGIYTAAGQTIWSPAVGDESGTVYVSSQEIGQGLELPNLMVLYGTFAGWFSEEGGKGTSYSAAEVVTEDATWYAYILPNQFQVRAETASKYTLKPIDPATGLEAEEIMVSYYDDINLLLTPLPETSGFVFDLENLAINLEIEGIQYKAKEDGSVLVTIPARNLSTITDIQYTGGYVDVQAPQAPAVTVYGADSKGPVDQFVAGTALQEDDAVCVREDVKLFVTGEDNGNIARVGYVTIEKENKTGAYTYATEAALKAADEKQTLEWTFAEYEIGGIEIPVALTAYKGTEVYVCVEDEDGNRSYANLKRLYKYTDLPKLQKVDGTDLKLSETSDGDFYFKVAVPGDVSVSILDGETKIGPNAEGVYRIAGDNQIHRILLSDEGGYQAQYTVTVYHLYRSELIINPDIETVDEEALLAKGWIKTETGYAYDRPYYQGMPFDLDQIITREGYKATGFTITGMAPITITANSDFMSDSLHIYWVDTEEPTVTLKKSELVIESLWDTISFVLFADKESRSFVIEASDNETAAKDLKISYFTDEISYPLSTIKAGGRDSYFKTYEGEVIATNGKQFIYAKTEDEAGNVTYNRWAVHFDNALPAFTFVTGSIEETGEGTWYQGYGSIRFKVTDESDTAAKLTVGYKGTDGKIVSLTPDENGIYTLQYAEGSSNQYSLVAQDEAGNTTECEARIAAVYSVTVNQNESAKGFTITTESTTVNAGGDVTVYVALGTDYTAVDPVLCYAMGGEEQWADLQYDEQAGRYYAIVEKVAGSLELKDVGGVHKKMMAAVSLSDQAKALCEVTLYQINSDHMLSEYVHGTAIEPGYDLAVKVMPKATAEATNSIGLYYSVEGVETPKLLSESLGEEYTLFTITGESGLVTILDVIGFKADTTAPVITGLTADAVYEAEVSFTVTDTNLAGVVDAATGKELTADADGFYHLTVDYQAHIIIASDASGNQTSIAVKMGKLKEAMVSFDALETGNLNFTQSGPDEKTYTVTFPTATKTGYTLSAWVYNGKKYLPGSTAQFTYEEGESLRFAAMWSGKISYSTGSKVTLNVGEPYRISGASTFRISADPTVYQGNVDFYASEAGEIQFE